MADGLTLIIAVGQSPSAFCEDPAIDVTIDVKRIHASSLGSCGFRNPPFQGGSSVARGGFGDDTLSSLRSTLPQGRVSPQNVVKNLDPKTSQPLFNEALPQNQWVGFGMKSGFMRQITVVSSALIGVETREHFQRALSVCRWQLQSRRSGSAKGGFSRGVRKSWVSCLRW